MRETSCLSETITIKALWWPDFTHFTIPKEDIGKLIDDTCHFKFMNAMVFCFFTGFESAINDFVWSYLPSFNFSIFLFCTRWKNPYNVSHVLNRWSMTLFLPICERFTGRAKHYAPGRKKMLKPQSSFSIFPRNNMFIFYFIFAQEIGSSEERTVTKFRNHFLYITYFLYIMRFNLN